MEDKIESIEHKIKNTEYEIERLETPVKDLRIDRERVKILENDIGEFKVKLRKNKDKATPAELQSILEPIDNKEYHNSFKTPIGKDLFKTAFIEIVKYLEPITDALYITAIGNGECSMMLFAGCPLTDNNGFPSKDANKESYLMHLQFFRNCDTTNSVQYFYHKNTIEDMKRLFENSGINIECATYIPANSNYPGNAYITGYELYAIKREIDNFRSVHVL